MAFPSISIVIPAKNEGSNVKMTLDSLYSTKTNHSFEVIVIDDDSDDGCCEFLRDYKHKKTVQLYRTNGMGAASARNYGANFAKGGYLIFCDAHLTFTDWWIDRLFQPLLHNKTHAICPAIASMNNPSSIGYGQTLKPNMTIKWNKNLGNFFETAILPGGCFMIPKNIFDEVGGFETGFLIWGYEDIEISIKLWLFGYTCHVLPSVTVNHVFRKKQPYTVESYHLSYNLLRMAYLHFNTERIQKSSQLIKFKNKQRIKQDVIRNGVKEKRKLYFQKRKYLDDWFFRRFHIPF